MGPLCVVSLYFYWRPLRCQRRDPDIPPQAFFGIPPPPTSAHQPLHPSDHQNWSSKSSQGPHLSVPSAVSGRGGLQFFLTGTKCNFFSGGHTLHRDRHRKMSGRMPSLKKERRVTPQHGQRHLGRNEREGKRAGAVMWDHLGKWSPFPSSQFQTCSPAILR